MIKTLFKILFQIALTMVVLSMAACGTTDSDSDSETNNGELILNLNTLEADSPEGTFYAKPLPDAYVGEVSSDLFIAVTVTTAAGETKSVTAYLCNGRAGVWLNKEVTDEIVTLSNGDTLVEVDLSGSEVTGTVALANGDTGSFTASAATGNAGLYRAEEIFDGVDYIAGWVVLPDDRQRGWWQAMEEEEELQM